LSNIAWSTYTIAKIYKSCHNIPMAETTNRPHSSIEPNDRFFENAEYLLQEETTLESTVSGSTIKLRFLTLPPAVLLARALTERLEEGDAAEYSGGRFDFMMSSDLGDAIDRDAKKRNPLLETRPSDKKFGIRLERSESSYELTADLRKDYENDSSLGGASILNTGFIALMNEIKLAPGAHDPLDESVEDVLEEVFLEVRGSSRTAGEVRSHKEADIRNAEQTLKMLGAHNEGDLRLLEKLWADRSLDRVALIDLFLHLVDEKRRLKGAESADYYPSVSLEDMVDTGKHISGTELRSRQQRDSVRYFTDELGFNEAEIERRTLNANRERALSFRYAAWLIEQPFMSDLKRGIKKTIAGSKTKPIPSVRIFVEATSGVSEVYKQHKENLDGKYDLSVGWQNRDYQEKLQFLRTCLLLCMNVFFEKDVSSLVNSEV